MIASPTTRSLRAAGWLAVCAALAASLLAVLSPSASAATVPALAPGARLAAGKSVGSANGQMTLTMTTAGALQLAAQGQSLWTSGTTGAGNWLAMQTDGNLVIYTATNRPVWATNTFGAYSAVLTPTGALQVVDATALVHWTTGTTNLVLTAGHGLRAGQFMSSPSGTSTLVMQADGNLVLYTAGRATWASYTYHFPGSWAVLQNNGDLVIYSATNKALWHTSTFSGAGNTLTVTDDGYATNFDGNGVAIWRIPGSNHGTSVVTKAIGQKGLMYCYDGGTISGPSAGRDSLCTKGKVGFDCSGLALYSIYQALHISLPHYSGDQYNQAAKFGGVKVSRALLQPGDLVFFTGADGSMAEPGHVGIYAGNNLMVDAQQDGVPVGVHTLYSGFVGGARYWK